LQNGAKEAMDMKMTITGAIINQSGKIGFVIRGAFEPGLFGAQLH